MDIELSNVYSALLSVFEKFVDKFSSSIILFNIGYEL